MSVSVNGIEVLELRTDRLIADLPLDTMAFSCVVLPAHVVWCEQQDKGTKMHIFHLRRGALNLFHKINQVHLLVPEQPVSGQGSAPASPTSPAPDDEWTLLGLKNPFAPAAPASSGTSASGSDASGGSPGATTSPGATSSPPQATSEEFEIRRTSTVGRRLSRTDTRLPAQVPSLRLRTFKVTFLGHMGLSTSMSRSEAVTQLAERANDQRVSTCLLLVSADVVQVLSARGEALRTHRMLDVIAVGVDPAHARIFTYTTQDRVTQLVSVQVRVTLGSVHMRNVLLPRTSDAPLSHDRSRRRCSCRAVQRRSLPRLKRPRRQRARRRSTMSWREATPMRPGSVP